MRSGSDAISAKHQVEARGLAHAARSGSAWTDATGAMELAVARFGMADQVCSKLRLMRKPLSNLNKEAFANIDKREMDLRDRLHCIQT
ncbi:hypothetical protein RIF29_29929 [Crotalaria pallida]|uniref:Uncharacterized protein n=1 Tax=Crotalaria pallida TaxID=3830 RepID=A0AAN9HUB4_CROPI